MLLALAVRGLSDSEKDAVHAVSLLVLALMMPSWVKLYVKKPQLEGGYESYNYCRLPISCWSRSEMTEKEPYHPIITFHQADY